MGRIAWVDWFPCAFMRGTRPALGAAFPNLRLPLEHPVTRRVVNPFTREEEGYVEDFDPAPVGSPLRSATCEPPPRPPLPFVPFPSAGYWHEEFPDLFAAATGVALNDDEREGPRFNTLALYGSATLNGTDLLVFAVPIVFRDALASLDVAGCEALAHKSRDLGRVISAHRERRQGTVRDLVRLSREAAASGELLFIWSNT